MMDLIYQKADLVQKLETEYFKEGMKLIAQKEEDARKEQVEALKNHNKPKFDVDPDAETPKKEEDGKDAE